MKTVTFDFDDTIVLAHMLIEENQPIFVFDDYHYQIINLIRSHIDKGDDVHIVTARSKEKEDLFENFAGLSFALQEQSLEDYQRKL